MKNKEMKKQETTIHQFWHSRDSSPELPAYVVTSLNSFARFPAHRVLLWTYQDFNNVPDGVNVMNAAKLIPQKKAGKWIEGGVLSEHFSDLIRLLAIQHHGGWWVDSDTIALRDFSTYDQPYAFQTYPAKRTGPFRIRNVDFPALEESNAHEGWDGKDFFNIGVLKAPPDSEFLQRYIEKVEANLDAIAAHPTKVGRDTMARGKGKMEWNIMVKTGRDLVKELGLERFVTPTKVFHPWHELSSNTFKQRVKKPESGPFTWFGHEEQGLNSLLQDETVYALSLSGKNKQYYEFSTLSDMEKLL